jgi:hypothetical protein
MKTFQKHSMITFLNKVQRFVWLCISGLVFGSTILFSCNISLRNEVDANLINREAGKLVVASFISPQDTVLAARIGVSNPVLGSVTATSGGLNPVTNAVVIISNGSRFAALRYVPNYNNLGFGIYIVSARDFPIVAGQTYKLTVETPDGKKVDAQCTIPATPPTPEARFDSAVSENGFSSSNGVRTPFFTKEYGIRLQWTDPAGQRNYYRASAYFRSSRVAQPANSTVAQPITVSTTFFENNGLQADAVSSDGGRLISRRGVYYRSSSSGNSFGAPIVTTNPDNTTTTIYCTPTCTTYITGPSGTTTIQPPPGTSTNPASLTTDPTKIFLSSLLQQAELTYSLLHVDENYYRYHDSILRQDESEGNPFAEPVPIPTNINGGLGCFAGYNRSTVVVKIK